MKTHPDTDTPTALDVARAYHRAWAAHDFDRAMTFVDDDIVCNAPPGPLVGAEAFRGFMGPFVEMVEEVQLRAVFGDEHTAVTMYDTRTPLVGDAPGAELITVGDGRIVQMRLIFDRLAFHLARAGG